MVGRERSMKFRRWLRKVYALGSLIAIGIDGTACRVCQPAIALFIPQDGKYVIQAPRKTTTNKTKQLKKENFLATVL